MSAYADIRNEATSTKAGSKPAKCQSGLSSEPPAAYFGAATVTRSHPRGRRNDSLRYLFEDFVLDTDRRELRRGTGVVPTTPQVFDLLDYLIRHRDRVVSKDDLISAVWNGRIVSDAALTTRLNAARAAIGDDGDKQRLIKTIAAQRLPLRWHSAGREDVHRSVGWLGGA